MLLEELTFEQSINRFLEDRNISEKQQNTNVTYLRKLTVFKEYLQLNKRVNDSNFKEILRGLDEFLILDSIDYYVKTYNVSFSTTNDSYLEAILAYLKYLNQNSQLGIKVSFIDSNMREEQLRKDVKALYKKLELSTSENKLPLSIKEVEEVLLKCARYISEFKVNGIYNTTKKNPQDTFISAIITKLVCLTGLKNSIVYKLKLNDFDSHRGTLKLGKIKLKLPLTFVSEMKKYLELRDIIVNSKGDCDYLFLRKEGIPIGFENKLDNSYAFKVVKKTLDHHGVGKLSKAVIIEYLKKGYDVDTISNFTGFGIITCLHCQEILNQDLKCIEENESNGQEIVLETWK